ncbi:MAG: GNAT family N-acetyltransferase [Planktomarina sp.]
MFWNAFGIKLGLTLGPQDKAIRFLQSNLIPRFSLAAYDGDILLGVAGFKTEKGGLVGGDLKALAYVYGWPSVLWRGAMLDLLERPLARDQLLMDGIFVTADARGRGVGTALLNAVKTHARDLGKRQVRLDVIAENPRAKALYLREGFYEIKTTRSAIAKSLFKISASTEMAFDL